LELFKRGDADVTVGPSESFMTLRNVMRNVGKPIMRSVINEAIEQLDFTVETIVSMETFIPVTTCFNVS
jgi:hypothetical protein